VPKRADPTAVFKRKRKYPDLYDARPGEAVALVVGLGNPGRGYSGNRHNAGFMAADALIREVEVIAEGKWSQGHLFFARSRGTSLLVLKPMTFMNESGRAVSPVVKHYQIDPGRMIVLHDDIDIPAGAVRPKKGGGTAGHRGLESIVKTLRDRDFQRVRIGVGRPPEGVDPADYVLSDFGPGEEREAEVTSEQAARVALDLVEEATGDRG
jgi:peptidyl-tRNA hydrolase, PTH1 family